MADTAHTWGPIEVIEVPIQEPLFVESMIRPEMRAVMKSTLTQHKACCTKCGCESYGSSEKALVSRFETCEAYEAYKQSKINPPTL
jgi:hypothetical protein